MKKSAVRGLLSVMLAAALFFLLPATVRAETEPVFRKIAGTENLTTGQYVLLTPQGYAPLLEDEGSITFCTLAADGDALTETGGAEWSLAVSDDGVILTDAGGTSIAPTEDGETGIAPGEYGWQVSWDGEYFSFHGSSAEEPVTLAFNELAESFNACKDNALNENPDNYFSRFTLYRREEDTAQSEEPEPEEASPDVTITPDGGSIPAGADITLTCEDKDAELYYALSADGETFSDDTLYTGPIRPEAGFGTLYLRAYAHSQGCKPGAQTQAVFTEDTGTAWEFEWKPYFGQLHAHTVVSDGTGTVEEAFGCAANMENLDFFAVTDHSHCFEKSIEGIIDQDGAAVSPDWARGKQAAASVTNESFVGIFGYEMSWEDGKRLGHLATFNTPGWQTREQKSFESTSTALENYYKALTTVPGSVSQFNHPGNLGDFDRFSHYSAEYDRVISLLEVAGEDGKVTLKYYNQALDNGWHVAPANNQSTRDSSWADSGARTVALAEELTETALYEAMANRRVYATQDSDLAIYYTLNGAVMGSVIPRTETPVIRVFLEDPTDDAVGTVEVVADGGEAIASAQAEMSGQTLELSVSGGYSYYYLRITQPDGDIAVTAPVWLDGYEDVGIRSFTSDTLTPVRGEEINLTVELFNDEPVDFAVESLVLYVDGEPVPTGFAPETVAGMGTLEYSFPYAHSEFGVTELKVVAAGSVNGESRTYEKAITLSFRVPEQVRRIAVDGSHDNSGVKQLTRLADIASQANIEVEIFQGEMPENCSILLISAPAEPFEPEFAEKVRTFAQNGGTVILCGQSDMGDWQLHCAEELNKLLQAMGGSIRLNDDTAWDESSNGGTADAVYTTVFNPGSSLTASLRPEQRYGQHAGCTVDPGQGTWLVKGLPTTCGKDMDDDEDGAAAGKDVVLLAWEELPGGGKLYVSGGLFLADREMPEQDNIWDPVTGNQAVLEALLGLERAQWPLKTIGEVRSGQAGQLYHIRGRATSGTSHPGNIFENTLYLQDDTGGIALVPFTEPEVEVGTLIEAIGQKEIRNGNMVLKLIEYQIQEETPAYRYAPETISNKSAMDYEANGGSLLQVEGKVTSVNYTAGGKGVCRFTVKDKNGDLADVLIESAIVSESDGKNELAFQVKKGRTVRAIGILHMDSRGNPVLRVRNCDEVVYVPPVPASSGKNPRTGDRIRLAVGIMALSAIALGALAIGKAWKRPAKKPGGKYRSGRKNSR